MLKLFKSSRCQSCYERAIRVCPAKEKTFAGNAVMKHAVIHAVRKIVIMLLKKKKQNRFLHLKPIPCCEAENAIKRHIDLWTGRKSFPEK